MKHFATSVTITGTPICDNCGKVLTYATDEICRGKKKEEDEDDDSPDES